MFPFYVIPFIRGHINYIETFGDYLNSVNMTSNISRNYDAIPFIDIFVEMIHSRDIRGHDIFTCWLPQKQYSSKTLVSLSKIKS